MHEPCLFAVSVGLFALLAGACGGERWLIGAPLEDPADAGPALDAAAPRCSQSPSEGIPAVPSPPLLGPGHAGDWTARLSGEEAGKFPSDLLQLELSSAAARLRLVTPSPLPPLLDARAGYLCRAPGASSCATPSGFVGAFDYVLSGVESRGSILSFGVFLDQPWDEWCQLQTPIEQRIPGCDPFYDVEPAYTEASWAESCAVRRDAEWLEIDCDRLATVERHACVCSADSCRAATRLQAVSLRLVSPDALEGALWFEADHAQVLHFERQSSSGIP